MSPPKAAEQVIEAASSSSDPSDADSVLADSLYESEAGSTTDTLMSGWLRERIKHEHGRDYLRAEGEKQSGAGLFPIDETQLDQLDLFHMIYTEAMTFADKDRKRDDPVKLYRAPIAEKPQRILDVGTGTGIWAIDIGDRHPSAEVIGFDTAPVQPRWVPPNVKFEVNDLTEHWTYTPGSFDLVHLRAMHAIIPDWKHVFENAYRVMKPGGHIEVFSEISVVESDDDTLGENIFGKYILNLETGLKKLGMALNIEDKAKPALEASEFENLTVVHYKVPIGPWPKDPRMKSLGAKFLVNLLQGIEGWGLALYTKILGWSVDDAMKEFDEVRKSLRNRKAHTYMRFANYVAQKPLNAPAPAAAT